MELIVDAYNPKQKLPANKGSSCAETKKFTKAFFAVLGDKATLEILPSNAFEILKLLNNLSPTIQDDLKITNSVPNLLNSALQNPAWHLELLDYALKNISEFGYKYASQIAQKILFLLPSQT